MNNLIKPVWWERPSGREGRGRSRAEARSHGGFVLLEVILAATLLAIALVALVDCLSRCVAAARSVRSYGVSETLLANKSFEFRVERPTDFIDQEGVFADYPDFRWSRTLEAVDDKGLWKQTITVHWQERGQTVSDSLVEYRYLPEKQL